MTQEKHWVKCTSAFTLDGKIVCPGAVVRLDDSLAKNLIQRGSVELATAEDIPTDELDEVDGSGQAAPNPGAIAHALTLAQVLKPD